MKAGHGNRYFALRHGQSEANIQGIIVSRPEQGVGGYGLTTAGRRQVEAAVAGSGLGPKTVIVSSDFRRARQSAELAARLLGCPHPPVLEAGLRERFFGEFDLGPDNAYEAVWSRDARDPDHRYRGVESARSVTERGMGVVTDLEQHYRDRDILLVAHGDVLQLLMAAFGGLSPARHRDIEHLATGELRALVPGQSETR